MSVGNTMETPPNANVHIPRDWQNAKLEPIIWSGSVAWAVHRALYSIYKPSYGPRRPLLPSSSPNEHFTTSHEPYLGEKGRPYWTHFPDFLTLSMQTLLVDGYISRSFNSRAAEEYFFHLLKRNHIPACRVVSYAGIESRFFVVDSAPPHVPIRAPSESPCVLDRSLTVMGTVVPQTIWSPVTAEDRRRLVGEAELQMPIFFEGPDGKLGVPLEACAAGRCDGLINAQELAQLGQRSIINIRIMVGGISTHSREKNSLMENIFTL